MRTRKAARLLIINPAHEVLLFRFNHHNDALAGKCYWATPGGGLEDHETFEQAAARELYEETGIRPDIIGGPVASSTFEMPLPDGETVRAEERFFVVKITATDITKEGWSAHEKNVMDQYHWWARDELQSTTETVYPLNLLDLLADISSSGK